MSQQQQAPAAMASTADNNDDEVETTLQAMAEVQRKRQTELHRQTPTWSTQYQERRCGHCDDCYKELPCLVTSVDTEQPGAFTVSASATTARVQRFHNSSGRMSHHSSGPVSLHSSLASMDDSSRRLRSASVNVDTSVAVAAVVVEDQDEAHRQREQELAQHEAQLSAREAQLQAWQEELERQRQELTQQQEPQPSESVPVAPLSSSVVVAVPEETIERNELGSGPMRFAPNNSMRSSQAQVMGLDSNMILYLQEIEQKWNQRQAKLARQHGRDCRACLPLTPQWHMRFLWFYAKAAKPQRRRRLSTQPAPHSTTTTTVSYQVNMKKVWAAEKKLQKRFVALNVATLGPQLYSKTLFPVPGLTTKGGHPMFYMRPSRYFPKHTDTKTIIDNLIYVMNTMLENSQFAQKEGIGFIACMDSWKMVNFEVSYCYQFMMALQGFMVPVKTQLFLIVNPPSWFGAIWKIMKPMLAPSFQKKVKIVPESKIHKYLAPGFEQVLPNDMQSGQANTDAMVVDFIAYRQYVEQGQVEYNINNIHHHHHHHHDASTVGGESSTGDVSCDDPDECRRHHHGPDHTDHTDSMHDSLGNLTGTFSIPTTSSSSGGGDLGDDDGASIHCDIDNEDALDDADMKQSSEVFIANMPRFDHRW
ncbi:expressed unknown protein [Seminavis robusta]|uniref:CRAL-TRIO domain-containing protein n=1 Tax=Seminavis robusta TaxID=568900 RepID=A0A9N8DFN3_9STRA|nr:expressed unknown protein [Seminavis robusta]|eukprot:Sro127_g060900.1 n/a (646) ;mRNA; f:76592-78529